MFGQEDAVDGRRQREAEDAEVGIPLGHQQILGVDVAQAGHHLVVVDVDQRRVAADVGHQTRRDPFRRVGRQI